MVLLSGHFCPFLAFFQPRFVPRDGAEQQTSPNSLAWSASCKQRSLPSDRPPFPREMCWALKKPQAALSSPQIT